MEIDDGFLDWIANPLSEDYEYNMKTKELKRDFRSTKPQYSDINGQYKNFAEFQKTQEYQNTVRARALLSDSWDTDSDSLRETLMSTWKMSTEDVNQCFCNLANSKDVDVHENAFNHTIKFRKR
jgi:hypothetical protein